MTVTVGWKNIQGVWNGTHVTEAIRAPLKRTDGCQGLSGVAGTQVLGSEWKLKSYTIMVHAVPGAASSLDQGCTCSISVQNWRQQLLSVPATKDFPHPVWKVLGTTIDLCKSKKSAMSCGLHHRDRLPLHDPSLNSQWNPPSQINSHLPDG